MPLSLHFHNLALYVSALKETSATTIAASPNPTLSSTSHFASMAVHKHPISHYWIRHTLVPFLLYAFASMLPYPADISGQIRRSMDFCLQKADHPSDDDDLIFERILMAIMHRHKNLAPDLELVVDNLERLAMYLIRRAQLRDPYELLERQDVGSAAWTTYEQQRLEKLMFESASVNQGKLYAEIRARSTPRQLLELVSPTRPPASPAEVLLSEDVLDPRLLYAQQGNFAAANIPTQLTVGEDKYYRSRNQEFEEFDLLRKQQQAYQPIVPALDNSPYYEASGRAHTNSPSIHGYIRQPGPHQQLQQLPTAPNTLHQHAERQALPITTWISHEQYSQPQPALSNVLAHRTFNQPTFIQYATPQAQTAPYQPFSPPHAQQPPRQFTTPVHPQLGACSTPSYLLSPQRTFLPSHKTSATPISSSTNVQHVLQSNDRAHRGTDWSFVAAQRAREFTASITAQERDGLAQRIIQRRHAFTMQSPSSEAKANESAVITLLNAAPHNEVVKMGMVM